MSNPFTVFPVFLLFFREENDFDAGMHKPLWMTVPQLEKQVIEHKMILAELKGEDTKELEDRLDKIVSKQESSKEKLKRH